MIRGVDDGKGIIRVIIMMIMDWMIRMIMKG